MPLIIHPSSCCDVCLEGLTYDDPRPPYAIPCGHIFCRACLMRTDPHNCPLCRKAYLPERAKKLITGEQPAASDLEEIELLQKLVVSWEVEEQQLVDVIREVETWLSGKEENSNIPLRKAREALRVYQRLKTQTEDDRRVIRHLKREIRSREATSSYAKDTASAVEESLLAQVEDLNTKVAQYESEIEKLHAEYAKYRNNKNPLPPPPEPVPLHRLPGLTQVLNPGPSSHSWQPVEDPTAPPATRSTRMNGFATPSDISTLRPQITEDEDGNTRYHQLVSVMPPRSRRDRKGKGRARDDTEEHYDIYQPAPIPDEMGGTSLNGNRHAIIPGATPNQRVIPKSVLDETLVGYEHESPVDIRAPRPLGLGLQFDSEVHRPLDPYVLGMEYLSEYAGGYNEGYQTATAASAPRNRGFEPPPMDGPTRTLRLVSAWPTSAPNPPRPDSARYSSTAGDVPRQTGQWREPSRGTHHISSAPPPAVLGNSNYTTAPTYMQNGVVHQANGYGEAHTNGQPPPVGVPLSSSSAGMSHSTIADNSRPRSHRGSTVQPDGNMSDYVVSGRASDASTIRPPGIRRRSAVSATRPTEVPIPNPGTNGDSSTRDDGDVRSSSSRNSWGTVESGAVAPSATTGSSAIRSVADLPLTFFDQEVRRGSMQSDTSLISFSRGNPFQSQSPLEEVFIDRRNENSTPRNRTASFSAAAPVHPPTNAQATDWSRDRHFASYPATPAQLSMAQGSRYTQAMTLPPGHVSDSATPAPVERSRRSSNRRHAHPRNPPPAAPLDDANARPTTPPHASTMWPLSTGDNALGLQLDLTDHVTQITAPTPMVSSRAFLRSFSYDNYA